MQTGEFESDEEYKQYVDICVAKAGQLKDLSDKLFRYFFVYSGHTDELKMEVYHAKEFFLTHLINDRISHAVYILSKCQDLVMSRLRNRRIDICFLYL